MRSELCRRCLSSVTKAGGLAFDPSQMTPLMATIRSRINESAINFGRAPKIRELACELQQPEADIRSSLQSLADLHAVVLHPESDDERGGEVWLAHPFAFYPTLFQVEFGDQKRRIQSPCIWCSLGIGAALYNTHGEDCLIYTCIGGAPDRPVSILIQHGEVEIDKIDWKVHFVVPAKEAWGNVIHTCANMLVFENETQIESWCEQWEIARGDVRSLKDTMDMASGWYGHYLEEPWRKLNPKEVNDLFDRTGFNNKFWSLS